MTVPDWVQDSIFYQIFPDRFANGDPNNDPPNVQPWGEAPTTWGFQGGDLKGVMQRFDYLLELGINAIYLNPIFQATSNHRYNTTDYYKIDPKLGTSDDFHTLLDLAHASGVRVILDGVFNHCGRGFFAFNDLLENQDHSPYVDWFHVLNYPVEAYKTGKDLNYLAWWKTKSLPKFNTSNPATRRYLLDVARYWIELGADGWRLDVPNEIDDDTFWAEFRTTVKNANPDCYLVGEIWKADTRWVGPGHFDGLLNYPMREALIGYLAEGNSGAAAFAHSVVSLLETYAREHAYAHYLPLGSHDTRRLRTVLNGHEGKIRLAFLFQFCYPGAPAIYYGDEIGLEGEKDPDCRRAFPPDPETWDQDLLEYVKQLAKLRHELPQLRRGEFRLLSADDSTNVCAFGRVLGEKVAIVVLNASDTPAALSLPVGELNLLEGQMLVEALRRDRVTVADGSIGFNVPAYAGALFHTI
jgi:cyclomaltodextrinase